MPQSFYLPEGTNGTAFTRDDHNLEMADTIDGLAQKNARMWQIITLVSLSSFFIALGILIYAVTLPETVPVVVTVNSEGEAAYVGKIDKSSYGKTAVPDIARGINPGVPGQTPGNQNAPVGRRQRSAAILHHRGPIHRPEQRGQAARSLFPLEQPLRGIRQQNPFGEH
jgi:hypothetical protein